MDGILNEDLATVDGILPFLKQCVGKGKEIPPGNILQVQQITNISFPTYDDKPNYDCDRHTLKITVTDGHSQGYALIPESCPGINLNTPPGTKIKSTAPIPVQGSLFVLSRNNCEVLGGKVPKLYEKWDTQRKHAFKHEWGYTGTSVEGEGPPPWKPFGYKPVVDVAALRKMKTIDVVNKKDGPAGAAKSQFDMQRDEAISELQATANKQKFQKPNKHLLDKEITDIMDEGFSQNDAEYAMNRFKNTQKALKFLKESKNRQDGVPKEPPKPITERKDRRRKGKGIDEDEEQEVPAEYQRPTKSISLFGFIEGQIKTDSKPTTQTNGPAQNQGGRGRDLEDGMARLNMRESKSDSFGSGRGDRGRGGGRGYKSTGRGGGDSYQSHHNSQRYDSSNQRLDTNSTRYDNSSQRYDSSNQRYDNSSQRRDNNSSQRYDNSSQRHDSSSTQRYDNGSQRHDSQRYDNSQRHDSSNQRYDNNSQRHDNNQRYDNNSQRHDSSSQRYDNNSQRYENRGSGIESMHKPPRFQNRGGSDGRQADYPSSGSRNMPSGGGGYDSYRDRQKESFDSRSYHEISTSRPEYTGNYQSQQQRLPTGKDRSYQTEYQHQPQQQQQQQQQHYSKSNDYPVPSQTYQQYQHQSSQHRQYGNTSSQNQDSMGHRGGTGQQRQSQSHYPNQSSGGNPSNQQNASGEFTHYQYGYEGYNPSQSLVFTRSKPDNRNRGGYQGRGAASQSSSYSRDTSSRY